MALIKCNECGHMISDRATKCPKCGCPTTKRSEPHIPQETPQVQPVYYEDDAGGSSRKWLYGIIALLVALIVGGGYYFFNKANGTEREEVNEIRIDSLLADGHYTFKGNWESSRYSAQPCKLEFEKNGMNLESCAYTNLKYDTRIPLTGTIQNDTLHFVGDISGKQLVINLKIASDGDMLIGEGIDYAHSGDKAKLKLTKISSGEEKVENEESLQEGDSDWLQGTWTINVNIMGQTKLAKLVIDGNNATFYSDGVVLDKGEYEIYDGKLNFNSSYFYIDEEKQLIKFDDNQYFNHSSQPTTSVNVGTPEQEKELKIMSRLHELGKKGQSLVSELSAMRQRGQMDPARYLYIKQALIQYKDEQIRLSQELGDEQMAREYMQQKDVVLQSFRMIENGY